MPTHTKVDCFAESAKEIEALEAEYNKYLSAIKDGALKGYNNLQQEIEALQDAYINKCLSDKDGQDEELQTQSFQ
ncbi:hypothetical protein COLO4_13450 [Corchorus olitorius]|uniref:Uncharacterized protein n=1 Tax=Corchorus olitorius TaxID=93759 RepID=A0A1R3JWN0_9ROSI|nr:hypothetical protein COLO4_13450 [Corchorus olitorius]